MHGLRLSLLLAAGVALIAGVAALGLRPVAAREDVAFIEGIAA